MRSVPHNHRLQSHRMAMWYSKDMKIIESTYRCLLVDVSRLTGFSEIRGSRYDLHWCLNEAPKLEKHLLEHLEHGIELCLDLFPKELRRLASGSLSDPYKMRYLRQLLLFSYKANVQHDNKTTTDAFRAFVSTNEEVRKFGASFSNSSPLLLHLAQKHAQSVIYRLRERDIVPFHGPGASTTPKERWDNWYESIEHLYPYSDYMFLYFNQDHCSQLGSLTEDHIEAKLIAVPKDSRGPRLICVHPAEAIWIQQGLRVALERAIRMRRDHPGPWPCGHVNFDDQSVNGRIALLSSRSRKYATLDLKEASDRLSEQLVQRLFGAKYKWFACCRAQKYRIADPVFTGYDNNIHSYAPMGNATTFPVQSLVFWAICCASMQSRGFHQPNSVFVFGDDIIVPSECAPAVMQDLQSFGLLPNAHKSFWKSAFRESCGVDAFNGINVTPVRWKSSPDAEHASELQPLSELAMRLRMAGYDEAATCLYNHIRCTLRRFFGKQLFLTNNCDHGGIAEYTALHSQCWRDAFWHQSYQRYVSPIWRLQEHGYPTVLNGWNHILESLTSLTRTRHSNVPDRSSPRATRLSRGWTDLN